jgi:hypothetical protein
VKTQQELACQLWEPDDTAARLLAILICRPKAFEHDKLDVTLREARTPRARLARRVTQRGSARTPPLVDHQGSRALVAPRTQPLCPDDQRIQSPAWRAPRSDGPGRATSRCIIRIDGCLAVISNAGY